MDQLPKIDLSTFFLSVSSAAFMSMGVIPSPEQKLDVNMTHAKQNIDLLELLEEKTKGNRTSEEEKLIQELLFQVRMRFLEIQNKRG